MPVSYQIDEKSGVVTAVLRGTKNDALNVVAKRIGMENVNFGETKYNTLIISDKFVGKAKCRADDFFSVDFGKRLAKARCMKKYYKAKDAAISNWFVIAQNRIDEVYDILCSIQEKQENPNSLTNLLDEYEKAVNELVAISQKYGEMYK